mgnify:CR=1 FL=1
MTFTKKRKNCVYGYVKGYSMWPCLIPGDILKARKAFIEDVTIGDIVVLNANASKPIVHRLIRKEKSGGNHLEITTAGDRSGNDPPRSVLLNGELLVVNAVLRNGKWKKPKEQSSVLYRRFPASIVRLHCFLVKRLCW